tara:strand:- start:2095 stop:2559 length:465 start_codon:yes stop_codon:yes gene_type:complete
MNATEIIDNVKELLHLSKKEVKAEDIAVEEAVELSTEKEVEIIEEVKEVILAEDDKKEVAVNEVAEAPVVDYVTLAELSAVKTELLSMIKALIEDKSSAESKEVPQELSKQDEIELSEEVVHSPETVIETKKNLLSNPNKSMTTEQRVNRMLFN